MKHKPHSPLNIKNTHIHTYIKYLQVKLEFLFIRSLFKQKKFFFFKLNSTLMLKYI